MKKKISLFLVFLLLQSFFYATFLPAAAIAQTTEETKPPVSPPAKTDVPLTFGLVDGTPVRLRTTRTVSSANAKTGQTVDFQVIEDVKIGDTIIIPHGAVALGTITEAKPKRRMGRSGKLNINIDSVRAASGDKLLLRAVKQGSGKSHVGAMTGAMVASGILFFPAAPLFLFMKGKDITIPEGTEVTGYVDGDSPLDAAKFVPASSGTTLTASDLAAFVIKSTPDGAEIEIDGKFAGSTPSTLQLKLGDHKIVLKKSGFLAWERSLTVAPGSSITLDAALEKMP